MKTPFEIILEVESMGQDEISKLPLSKLLYYKEVSSQLTLEERKKIIELTAYKHRFQCARCGQDMHVMYVKFGENLCINCINDLSNERRLK